MQTIFESELDDEWRVNWSLYVEDLVIELLRRKTPLSDLNLRTPDADTPLHTAAVIAVVTDSTKLVSVPSHPPRASTQLTDCSKYRL